jgi:hypothetical protein
VTVVTVVIHRHPLLVVVVRLLLLVAYKQYPKFPWSEEAEEGIIVAS